MLYYQSVNEIVGQQGTSLLAWGKQASTLFPVCNECDQFLHKKIALNTRVHLWVCDTKNIILEFHINAFLQMEDAATSKDSIKMWNWIV